MSEEASMNDALDALEQEHGIELNDAVVEDVENDAVDEQQEEAEPEQQESDNPPGFIDNMDDWIAAGKDPDLFKGKKAYSQEYERIQEIKELKGLVKQVVDTAGDWKQQQQAATERQIEKYKEDAKRELETAKSEHDLDGALEAQERLNALEKTKPAPQQNPVITEFFAKNPIVDRNSQQYDDEFFQDMAMAQQTVLDQLTGGSEELAGRLTEKQIKRSMDVAYKRAQALHPDKFQSPRNNRKSAPQQAKRSAPKATDYKTRLKNTNIKSKHNPRDNNAANDIYEMIKATDPKAAEAFAKNMLGE